MMAVRDRRIANIVSSCEVAWLSQVHNSLFVWSPEVSASGWFPTRCAFGVFGLMNWEKTVYQGGGVCSTLFRLGLSCALCRAVTLIVVALIGGVGTVQHQSQQLRVIECIQASLQLALSGRTFARNQQNAIRQPAPNAGIGERQHGWRIDHNPIEPRG